MKKLTILSAFIYAILSVVPIPVFALETGSEQTTQDYIKKDILYYDPNGVECVENSEKTGLNQSSTNAFIVGDSLAVGMQSAGIENLLSAENVSNVKIDASTGRSINGSGSDGSKTNAIRALKDNERFIEKSGLVVVILGSNPDNYKNGIPAYLAKIKNINSKAKVVWVNVGTTREDLDANKKIVNKTLEENKEKLAGIVDWNEATNKDPSLVSADKVHPSNYDALNKLTIENIKKLDLSGGITKGADGFLTTDKKMKPEERIYSFLIAKGLSPIQAVGWIVNIKEESGYRPEAGEFGSDGNLDKTVLNVGFGLIQWTNTGGNTQGRRYQAINKAEKTGKDPLDMDYQLNYMWFDITENYKNVYKKLKNADTIYEAQKVILYDYENPAEINKIRRDKTQPIEAKKLLKQLANLNTTTGFEDDQNCIPSSKSSKQNNAGEYGWEIKGNNKLVYYKQDDAKWSNKPYGNCPGQTIGTSACGATSLAMVVSTLTGENLTPPDMVKWAVENGFRQCSQGTDWRAFTAVSNDYEVDSTEIGKNLDMARETLMNGGLVIASFNGERFGNHFMVVRKVSEDGNSFYFADPYSGRGEKGIKTNYNSFTREEIIKENLLNMWAYESKN
jgi:hypothetical protein